MKARTSIKERLSAPENVALVTDWLVTNKGKSRTRLARDMCEQLGLRDGKAELRISTTLKALRELEAQGSWTLPAALPHGSKKWNPRRLGHAVEAPREVPERVEQIEGVELIEVKSGDDEHLRIWNELMLDEHPLHDCRLVGRQLRYLVGSPHGWLGGIGFGSSALYLESRDKWIGWDEEQRPEHHERVINMTRYLIRESVPCENLASQVLGLCSRRVAKDYHTRYGVEPWLMETFVDRAQYAGTCFQAANWLCVGQTKGRGRNGSKKEGKSIKDVYMYPLVQNFRARMGVSKTQDVEPRALECGLESDQWAKQEFAGCELGNVLLNAQLVKIAENKGRQPSGSYARACGGDRYALKGYYRLINNDSKQVSSDALMGGHREETIRRMAEERTALIIQDTMDMNFSARWHCKGLGLIGKNQTGAESQGLKMHSRLAVNDQGMPLGVLGTHIYAAKPKPDLEGETDKRPIEEKESYRWLQTYDDTHSISQRIPDVHIVCVGDRESDIFELFDQRRRQGGAVDLLVRAKHNRCLLEEEAKLFEHMAQGKPGGRMSITVPRQREKKGKPSKPGRPGLPARTAEAEVRFREVTICAPKTPLLRDKKPITLYAVYLFEKNPPPGATQLKWLLLTTMDVRSVKQAMKCVRWYCLRWRIEEWHRVLKSGCGVLKHQNHSAESLARAISIDAVVAWRIMLLALLGRELPELPCDLLFNSWECEVLQLLAQKKTIALGEAIVIIAKLGGYLNRRCDGPPGFQSLWRGYARFHDMVYAIILRDGLS